MTTLRAKVAQQRRNLIAEALAVVAEYTELRVETLDARSWMVYDGAVWVLSMALVRIRLRCGADAVDGWELRARKPARPWKIINSKRGLRSLLNGQ